MVDWLDAFIHTHITSSGGKLRCHTFFVRLKNSGDDNRKGVNDVPHVEVKNKKAPMKDAVAVIVFFSDHLSQRHNNKLSVQSSARSRGQGVCVSTSVMSACLFLAFQHRRRHSETRRWWQAAVTNS